MTEQPITILLLEDNPGDADLMREMVALYGGDAYRIEARDRLSGALDRLDSSGIDIIVTDMWVPDSEGLATFLALFERAPEIPIVILSGNEDERTAMAAVQTGAQDYFVKGQIDGPVLIRALRYAMERTRMFAERERLQQELFHSQKMESLSRLAGGIAHDFNNILTVILGNAHMGAMQCDPGTPLHDMLNVIRTAAEQARDLTQKLLGFSRADQIDVKPLPMNAFARELADALQHTNINGIKISLCLCDDDVFVNADYNQIFQAALNICNNAVDAMPAGGGLRIEISALHAGAADLADDPSLPPGDYAVLTITDTGPGIPDEILPRVFEPFITTKGKRMGAGLGLSVAGNIIEKHNGFIRIKTGQGKGAAVSVILPIVAAAAAAAGGVEPALDTNLPIPGAGTVLLVDDDDSVRDITSKILTNAGYTVIATATGKDAIDIYRKCKNDIDAVILDMIMPEMNGRDVFGRLREINPGVRALVISGYSEDGLVRSILDEGFSDYVEKPFTAFAITNALKKLIEE